MGEAVAGGAGFDDLSVEGEPVDDGGAEAGAGEGLGPANWPSHTFVAPFSGGSAC